ncbi:MAG: glycosyl hydrolase [Rhodoferax sp.]|uniref:glycosyl hydrolase n=1 Tax=Rhodoferax sp. TaxID=50421 RepID=UPI00260FAAB9|nr:glycosyl hydrolase [Rhodoferax sp.]MDD5334217.1 glycosyl hydrolase [Rhodoferax sp.]
MKLSAKSKCGLARLSLSLSLYLLATLGLTSHATSELGTGQFRGRDKMKEFLYSPYLDINVPLQAESGASAPSSSSAIAPRAEWAATALPDDVKFLTLAFATGECGSERWNGREAQTVADSSLKAVQRAGIGYVISTGGAQGVFTCASEQGMEKFIAHYNARQLLGFDFDIEAGQSALVIASLVEQVRGAMQRHPQLRFSFTLATLSSTDEDQASLNQHGALVMKTIANAGLNNYFINLMVMNYGEAKPDNCIVENDHCDMAASAIQVAQNFSREYGVPMQRIELTPMIGVNDVVKNVFTLDDARSLSRFVRTNGLGGLHYWSLGRDRPCALNMNAVSPTCSSLSGPGRFEFNQTFAIDSR